MKKNKIVLAIFFALTVSLFFITSAAPNLTGALKKTEVLQYGGLQVSDQVTCYLVREESVYLAGRAGQIQYYIEEGQQLRGGVRVLTVSPNSAADGTSQFSDLMKYSQDKNIPFGTVSQNNVTEFNGAISYYLDGFESIVTPETMSTISKEELESYNYKTVNVVRDNTVTGDPLYKIIDDNIWYILYWIDAGNISKYEIDKDVWVNLPLGQVKGKVYQILDDGKQWRVLLKFNRYYEDFAQLRKLNADVITSDNKGLIVRNESITAESGMAGVMVKDVAGKFKFKPIKVLSTNGEYSLIQVSQFETEDGKTVDTVNAYDEILIRPN